MSLGCGTLMPKVALKGRNNNSPGQRPGDKSEIIDLRRIHHSF